MTEEEIMKGIDGLEIEKLLELWKKLEALKSFLSLQKMFNEKLEKIKKGGDKR